MKLLLMCVLGLPAFAANFCLTVLPESPKESSLALGTGRDFFTWQLLLTRSTGPVTRAEIAERLPFAILPAWQATDVLDRRTLTDKRTVIAAYFGIIKDAGPAAMAYAAGRITDPYAKIGLAVGAGVWALAGGRAAARVPNPDQTKAHLLPDAGVMGDWDGVVVSGIVHGAAKVGPICNATMTPTPGAVFSPSLGFDPTAPNFIAVPTSITDGDASVHWPTEPSGAVIFDRTELEYSHSPAWYLARIMEARGVALSILELPQ